MDDDVITPSTAVPSVAGIRADVGRPGPQHKDLWDAIEARISDMLDEVAPTMGTVIKDQKDDGQVQVTLDNEADDREVPLSRKKGQRHLSGDRVIIHTMRGGDKVIGSTISSKGGRDPAVDRNDLFLGSVTRDHLDKNAVGGAELDKGVVSSLHLAPDITGRLNSIDGAGGALAQLGTGVSTVSANLAGLDTRIYGNGGTKDDLQGKIDDAKAKASNAQTDANTANQAIRNLPDWSTDIQNLKDDIANLKRKIKNLGGSST
jgi:hypothetical protein